MEGKHTWDSGLTWKENVTHLFFRYWLLLGGLIMLAGSLAYRPYGRDMQFLMDLLPWLGLLAIILGLMKEYALRKNQPKGLVSRVYHLVAVIVLFWLASVAAAGGAMLAETQRNPYMADVDVVLLGVELSAVDDQTMLSSRAKPTAYYLEHNPQARAYLVGGAYAPGEQTAAEYLRDDLLARGIAPERLILETRSTTLEEAIVNVQAMIEADPLGRQDLGVGLITHEFQLYRARKIAAREGMLFGKMCIRTPLEKLYPINFFVREYFKILPFWLGR